jgi:hypothetical protein
VSAPWGPSTLDRGIDYYVVTFVLKIPQMSTGEFVIGFDEDDGVTWYWDAHTGPTPIATFLPASIRVGSTEFPQSVPTTSTWGLLVLALLLAIAAKVIIRQPDLHRSRRQGPALPATNF